MNLETKITIYKFTPQLFTLTQEGSMEILEQAVQHTGRSDLYYC